MWFCIGLLLVILVSLVNSLHFSIQSYFCQTLLSWSWNVVSFLRHLTPLKRPIIVNDRIQSLFVEGDTSLSLLQDYENINNQYSSRSQKERILMVFSIDNCIEKNHSDAKMDINYLIVIVLICEFCNKFIYSTFDVIVSQYGIHKHQLTSLAFGYKSFFHSLIHLFIH